MGCDIHTIIQVQVNGKWDTVESNYEFFRSYNSFAILADVRNGVGFAGFETSEGFRPISEAKGYPEDLKVFADDYVEVPWKDRYEDSNRQWMGDHSHSFLTLEEMQEYWKLNGQTILTRKGVVPLADYLKMEKGAAPKQYSTWVSGPNLVVLPEKDILTGVPKDKEVYVSVEWRDTYDSSSYIGELIEHLESIQVKYKTVPEYVRLVFGFDN